MCGISGILDHKGNVPSISKLKEMLKILKERGPDDFGYLNKNFIALGHRRLAIRDLSKAGKCPMTSSDRRFDLVFNGEIYNWRELKSELEQLGHKFKSKSDTEVVLIGYQVWKEKLLLRLEGMFSMAIWDNRKRTLFLAVDRMGEKPLYYSSNKDYFIFGSSVSSVALNNTKDLVNTFAITNYLSNCFISSKETIWKNVQRLSPATYIMIKAGTKEKIQKYWDLSNTPPIKVNFKNSVNKVDEYLRKSVKKSLDADVPVGVFLSGGVDSSLIASYAKEYNPNIKAFSLGYKEQNFNELPFAEKVANHLSIEHKKIIIKQADVINILPKLVKSYGQPFGDASSIPTYYISKFASEDVKVCLSGDGGDELFGGYWRMQANVYANYYRIIMPLFIRRQIIPNFSKKIGYLGKRLNAINTLSISNIEKSYTNSESWFDKLNEVAGSKLQKYFNKDKISLFRVGSSSNKDALSLIQRVLYDDIMYQFPDALLTKVDVASMAASLEVRSPFLDKQLVELSWTLPDNFKLRLGERKYLLKKLASSYLPKEVIYRSKMGFGIPITEWFIKDLGDYGMTTFENSISEGLGFIKPNTFEKCLLKHKKTKTEATRLWLLLWLELWFKSTEHN